MKEDKPLPEADHDTRDDPNTEPRHEALQKTLHHIEAIKHILEASGIRPEPLELTLRNLEKLFDKGHAQVRDALNVIQRQGVINTDQNVHAHGLCPIRVTGGRSTL